MTTSIVKELIEVARNVSEADLRKFVQEHWLEFPVDIQDHLAVALMTDAVREQVLQPIK